MSNLLKKHGVNVTICKQDKLNVADVVTMYENMPAIAEIASKHGVGPTS